MTALLLAAVGGTGWQSPVSDVRSCTNRCDVVVLLTEWFDVRVALAADGLFTVVLGGEGLERGLDDTATETEDEVKG